MSKVYIISACRTPIGKFLGGLSEFTAPQLGSLVLDEALKRAKLDKKYVDAVYMGNVIQAGVGQNPARQAALLSKLPVKTPCVTVNMVCGSGMKSIIDGARSILCGDNHLVLAGGMESMSNAPHLLMGHRKGKKLGDDKIVDAMVYDGLTDAFAGCHMGMTAEAVHQKYKFSRKSIDSYAVESHIKAAAASASGLFKKEIVPVQTTAGVLDKDEGPRKDSTMQKLLKLPAVFKEKGVVTAGNSSSINDGASALLLASEEAVQKYKLKPIAVIDAYAESGLDPKWIMLTPVPATKLLLKKMKKTIKDFDLIEANEAFAVQMLAVSKELGLDKKKLNVHGGAVALGHPIGCSGARIVTTLIHALKSHKKESGLATLCMGGGNGLAMGISLV